MNKLLSLLIAGACALTITAVHAGHEPPAEPGDGPHILIMASDGAVGSGTHTYSERLGGLAGILRELGYRVTVSSEWAGLSSFTEEQRATLESYDLLWFPRRTVSGNWPREWQYLNVPILQSSPFVTHNSNWDWAFTRTGATEGTTSWMDVMQPHSILEGLEITLDYPEEIPNSAGDAFFPPNVSEHGRILYRSDRITAYSMTSAANYINGRGTGVLRHGMTEGDANPSASSGHLWHLYVWEPGQLRGNERRRVYFNINFEELLSSAATDSHHETMDEITDNGKELIRNVVEWVIAEVPVSEHLVENFERYAEGQSVIEPALYDTGRVRDDGNNYQWQLPGDSWSASANASGGSMNAKDDGYTMTRLSRRLVGGPEAAGAHPFVTFDFKLRLNDMSSFSTPHAQIVLGSTGGEEVTTERVGQNHVVGIQVNGDSISHLTGAGAIAAVESVGTTEWFEVSFLLNLDEQTYDLTITELAEEGAGSTVYSVEGEAFLATATSVDFVAVVSEANQAFDINLDDIFVTSSATAPAAGGFAAWVAEHFTPAESQDGSISGAEADPDGDQIVNLLEYVLGSNPRGAGVSGLPLTAVQSIDVDGATADYLTLSLTRSKDVADFAVSVDTSGDLVTWNEGTGILVSTDDEGNGFVTEVYRSASPISASAREFLRLNVKAVD